ncbi:hypothetical protein NKR23_g11746 [Pleurostoma richardsiae]|uniref:Methyltransferase domain-containing protein n=1 Tax=Pleurostoma richardsiae TaxID=41990 RepID=A0AA38R2M0_9PEZI|nr:hypothetical protein NKR23_g11746 [Pleurostoma richardsiae]
MGASESKPPPSAAVYNPLQLKLYDFVVLRISNGYAWRCSTDDVLLPFFRGRLAGSNRHLDVGVGNGFYLVKSKDVLFSIKNITLMDVNKNALDVTASRLARLGFRTDSVLHDVTEPWSRPNDAQPFDSISLFYLLHCLPGPLSDKADKIAASLKAHLNRDSGVLYGATILGDEARHNLFGKLLMRLWNKLGVFGNRTDKESDLQEALQRHFSEVEVRREGRVALFTASKPIGGDFGSPRAAQTS